MRSSFALVGVLGLVALASTACSITSDGNSVTLKTVPEFVDSTQPGKAATADWGGEPITIKNDGVNPLTGDGGIEIIVDPTATKVSASAVFAARADVEADAQLSIKDAIGTFAFNGNSVSCGHGQKHGTSSEASSGCKLLRVTIPAGSDTKPMSLTVGNGSGRITFRGAATVQKLTVDNNGLGEVSVSARPVKGAEMVITGDDKVNVFLPADFSAESVVITVNSDTSDETAKRINTSAFQGMESNKPYPTSGAGANAAKVLNVQSKGPFDDDIVTIAKL